MTRELLFLMNAEQALAFARLMEAANRGDGAAACTLGDMYREGLEGLRYSPKQAYRWYARSAMAGDPNGQNNLGACCEHGLGCAQSYAKAAKWYRLAAAQGLAYASSNLGYLHLRGHGVPRDTVEALGHFRLAVARGDDRAASEVERLEETLRLQGLQLVPEDTEQSAATGGCSAPLAGTQRARPCVLALGSLPRDGRPERLQPPDAAQSQSPDGPREQLQPLQTAPTNAVAIASQVITQEFDGPGTGASIGAGSASREPEGAMDKPKEWTVRGIRFVDETQSGNFFGLVGGVRPPSVTVSAASGEATDEELFPIYAECGMVPDDFEEGTARRFEEYLKWREQE